MNGDILSVSLRIKIFVLSGNFKPINKILNIEFYLPYFFLKHTIVGALAPRFLALRFC